jgi:uncharacterized protein
MRRMAVAFATFAVMACALPLGASAQDVPALYLYVNDFVGVLTYDEISTLDGICHELDEYNSDEIAVVIVNTTQPLGIDTFSYETFRANGIGKEDLNNGVMLLVSVDEGMWRIEVGYGLEGVLNDAKVGSIGRENLEPYLETNEYYTGVFYTVAALVDVLTADVSQTDGGVSLFGYHISWKHVAIAVLVFVALAVLTKGRILFWIGGILTLGRFGGGRSGGGGAKGRF